LANSIIGGDFTTSSKSFSRRGPAAVAIVAEAYRKRRIVLAEVSEINRSKRLPTWNELKAYFDNVPHDNLM